MIRKTKRTTCVIAEGNLENILFEMSGEIRLSIIQDIQKILQQEQHPKKIVAMERTNALENYIWPQKFWESMYFEYVTQPNIVDVKQARKQRMQELALKMKSKIASN